MRSNSSGSSGGEAVAHVGNLRYQVPSGPENGSMIQIPYGAVAQLGEHHTGSVGVRGSSPLGSTRMFLNRDHQTLVKQGGTAEALRRLRP